MAEAVKQHGRVYTPGYLVKVILDFGGYDKLDIIKKHVIDLVCKLKGDKLLSQTLSNLGNVELPEQMRQYVTEMDFVLGRQRGVPGAGACVSYNGNLFLNFSRNIVEADFESYFVDRIHQLGITTKQVSE